jgi:hypothetical protein
VWREAWSATFVISGLVDRVPMSIDSAPPDGSPQVSPATPTVASPAPPSWPWRRAARCAAIEEQARIVVADAEREVAQPADLALAHAEAVRQLVARDQPAPHPPTDRPDQPQAPSPPG